MGKKRNRRRNGGNGGGTFAAGYLGGKGCIFQDTIIVENTSADPSADIKLSTTQLIPSIGSGRRVIPDSITVEIMPTLWNSGATANSDVLQFQIGALDTTTVSQGLTYPVMPYKMVSNVNPTTATVNFRALKNVVPTIVRMFESDGTVPIFYVGFKPFDLTNPRLFQMKVTSRFLVMPQLDPEILINPT
mgnify:FL=1